MRDSEILEQMKSLQEKIDSLLALHTADTYEELYQMFLSGISLIFKERDRDWMVMSEMAVIWKIESQSGEEPYFLGDVNSMGAAVEKYVRVKLYLFRIGNDLERRFQEEAIDYFLDKGLTPGAVWKIFSSNLTKDVDAALKLCRLYLERGQDKWVMKLITHMRRDQVEDDRLNLLMAEEWMKFGQYGKAHGELLDMRQPAPEVIELIGKLDGILQ